MNFLAFFLFRNFFFIIDITNNFNFKLKHSLKNSHVRSMEEVLGSTKYANTT